jgi:hypothetical protein
MISPACQRFGEKLMRQLNNSARIGCKTGRRLCRSHPIDLAAQSARRQPKNKCGCDKTRQNAASAAGKPHVIHALRAQGWAGGAWPAE